GGISGSTSAMLNMRAKKKAPQRARRFFHREGILVWELTVRTRLRHFPGFDIYAATVLVESYDAVYQCKNRIIPAESHIPTRQVFCPALADDDVARDDLLAAEFLYA